MDVLPILRRLNSVDYTSGTVLAEALGVSRASVSLALEDAAALGVDVIAARARGYRLARPINWLDEAAVAQALGPAARYFDLKVFDTIDSTNTALMRDAPQGLPSGMVYAAEYQHGGRGRRGRRWHGALGQSLMMSLLWRFERGAASLSGLSLAVGVAMVRAFTQLGVAGTGLKWPNDLLGPQGKLGGVLVELSGDALGPSTAVIGIGLNVDLDPTRAAWLDQPADSLRACGYRGDRNQVLAAVLAALAEVLPQFEREGFAPFRAEWMGHHAWQGAAVNVLQADGRIMTGTLAGIDDDGSLLLDTPEHVVRLHGGELSLRRA